MRRMQVFAELQLVVLVARKEAGSAWRVEISEVCVASAEVQRRVVPPPTRFPKSVGSEQPGELGFLRPSRQSTSPMESNGEVRNFSAAGPRHLESCYAVALERLVRAPRPGAKVLAGYVPK